MRVMRKGRDLKIARLAGLLFALFLPLATLASCGPAAPPLFVSLNLGIPDAAMKSPVVGSQPDSTELLVGITFKINSQTLNVVGTQPLQPGQSSNLE